MGKNAEYQISTSMHDGIVEFIITGELSDSAHQKMTLDISAIAQENNVKKMLIDISDMKGCLSITETYFRVRSLPPNMYKIHCAMVDINGLKEYQRFHETTAVNAGVPEKWFVDIDAARAWLKSKSTG